MSPPDLGNRVARTARALGVELPIVQAGMGGVATPRLAAAVSEAGALGTIALYKLSGAQVEQMLRDALRRTACRLSVNVIPEVAGRLLDEQLRAVFAITDRPLVVNSYAPPPEAAARAVLEAGHTLLVQVGTLDQARQAVELGAGILACQGVEAGGHLLGTDRLAELLAQVGREFPEVPLLGAGGVADGAATREALRAGAGGLLCGTVFVATEESGAHDRYKEALLRADAADTVITDRFPIGWPGRRHRVLRGPVTDSPEPLPSGFIAWTTVMGERRPVPRGSAAAPTVEAVGAVDEMARYAGTGCGAVTRIRPAAEVVAELGRAFRTALGDGGAAEPAGTTRGAMA